MKGRQPSNEYMSLVIFAMSDITQFILLVKPCLSLGKLNKVKDLTVLYIRIRLEASSYRKYLFVDKTCLGKSSGQLRNLKNEPRRQSSFIPCVCPPDTQWWGQTENLQNMFLNYWTIGGTRSHRFVLYFIIKHLKFFN